MLRVSVFGRLQGAQSPREELLRPVKFRLRCCRKTVFHGVPSPPGKKYGGRTPLQRTNQRIG